MDKTDSFFISDHDGLNYDDLWGRDEWKPVLYSLIEEEATDLQLQLPKVHFVILTGGLGYGKTALLNTTAGEAISYGYRYLKIDLRKLSFEDETEVFKQIYEETISEKSTFLLLEHLNELSNVSALTKLYDAAEREKRILIIGADTEDETCLDAEIRKRCIIYPINLPNRKDREEYIQNSFLKLFKGSVEESKAILIDKTEGYTYLQMKSLLYLLKSRYKYEIQATDCELVENIEILNEVLEHYPNATVGQSQNLDLEAFEKMGERLIDRLNISLSNAELKKKDDNSPKSILEEFMNDINGSF